MTATYLDVISKYYPDVLVSTTNPTDYNAFVVTEGEMPSKSELDARLLDLLRENKWREIQAERDRRIAGGVKVGDNWFHSDNTSRIQQLALVIFGTNLPGNIMWKTMNGVFVEMTPALAITIFQTSAISDMSIFSVAEWHKAQMLLVEDPSTYDFSQGWPETYTGSNLL